MQLVWRKCTIDQYAHLVTSEMGKTLKESTAEIKKCVFYVEHAKEMLGSQKVNYQGLNVERIFAPLGVIYMIMQ